jgi:xylulokinase
MSPPGANNLLFLPYLLGERSPRWNPDAKGAFIGLKMTTSKNDIYRSVLEGVAFNLKVIMDILDESLGIEDIIVIGGGAKGKVWLQILADIWQKKVVVPRYMEEATSLGAAICGGVSMGIFPDFKAAGRINPGVEVMEPRVENKDLYGRLYKIFNRTYDALVPYIRI